MFAIRYSKAPDAKFWESGKPIGWVITIDGDFPFWSKEDRDEIVDTIRAETIREREVMS